MWCRALLLLGRACTTHVVVVGVDIVFAVIWLFNVNGCCNVGKRASERSREKERECVCEHVGECVGKFVKQSIGESVSP